MKSILKIFHAGASLLLCFALNTDDACGQKKPVKSFPIPAEVNSVLKPFCYSCHGEDGGRLPHSKLNLAVWNGYSPGKQAEKAASICSSMRKGTMPTKQWKQQNLGLKLTSDQIGVVCRWAEFVRLESEKSGHKVSGKKQKNIR